MQYQLKVAELPGILMIEDDGTIRCVPEDVANRDWQAYQAWLAADPENEPLPAE